MKTETLPRATGNLEDDLKFFRDNGFLIVSGMFSGEELAALQEETRVQIDAGPDREPAEHFRRGPVDDVAWGEGAEAKQVFFRIESVVGKPMLGDSMLIALGHPRMLQIVSGILDGEFACWGDALLFKGPEGGAAVPMHTALTFGDTSEKENLVVDVYLDHATPETGCLKVLPGSNTLPPEEVKELLKKGFDIPGLVDVELAPGDVLFHSEWMIHGSRSTGPTGKVNRRILYYAFRDPNLLASADSPMMRPFIAASIRRQQLAIERRRAAGYADDVSFDDVVPPGWEEEVAAVSEKEAFEKGKTL